MNNNKTLNILGILSIPIMYIVFFLAVKYISYLHFTYDLLFFATLGIIYVSLHFFFDIKKMYNFIFDKRYIISLIVFIILVIGKYNGSSVGMLNRYVDKDQIGTYDMPVLGLPRGIRSDEWAVSSLTNFSQQYTKYNKVNSLINGKDTLVNFYPRSIVKDYAMIMHPEQIGYLFLPLENAFSFAWYFPIIATFLVAVELFMILTRKNKLLSVLGAFMIVVAPAAMWWQIFNFVLYGGLALLIIYKFINTSSIKIRIILSILLGWVASCYLTLMYPAWMIPYAYFYLAIFIWMLIENKDKVKIKDSLYLIISLIVCAALFSPIYLEGQEVYSIVMNTEYPGKRTSTGGGEIRYLFQYILNLFYPYTDKVTNPCELSQYISLFPLSLVLAIAYLVRDKINHRKTDYLLLFMTIVTTGLFIWTIVPMPSIISKLTLLSMSTSSRCMTAISFACTFIYIYIIGKYTNDEWTLKEKIIVLILSIINVFIVNYLASGFVNQLYPDSISKLVLIGTTIMFIPVTYLLILNTKKTKYIFYALLFLVAFISSFIVMPINKGLSVVFDKPFAKEIRSIVEENKDARFLSISDDFVLANYVLANGAITINSTNYVPNLELWEKLDKDGKYREVYNRYSHIFVTLTEEETSFELRFLDSYDIYLNYNDLCTIDIDYLVDKRKQDLNMNYLEEVYNKNGMYIYKTLCNN